MFIEDYNKHSNYVQMKLNVFVTIKSITVVTIKLDILMFI